MTTLQQSAQELAQYGRNGDTILAHINPEEAQFLKDRGGSGTINPDTGLPEYKFSFKSVTKFIAPVAIIVVAIVAPEILPALGAYIAEAVGIGAVSATTAAAIGAGAVGAASGAVNAAVAGGNADQILKATAIGGAAGAAGGAAGSEVGQAVGTANIPGAAASGATTGAVSGATGAQLSGSNLSNTLKTAEIGGAVGGVAGGVTSGLSNIPSSGNIGDPVYDPVTGQELTPAQVAAKNPDLYPGGVLPGSGQTTVYKPDGTVYYQASPSPTDIALGKASGAATGQYLSGLFSPSQSSSTYGGGLDSGSAFQDGTVTTTGQSGTTPGSSALGQALRIGDPGAPIESPGGGEKTNAPVWNLASLRTKDETGS